MSAPSIDTYASGQDMPVAARYLVAAEDDVHQMVFPAGEGESCDVIDRMIAFGLPMDQVFAGKYTTVRSGHAEATFDPHALGGFVLRATADSYRGTVDIGFDTSGAISRSLLNYSVISADEALTLWFMASKDRT